MMRQTKLAMSLAGVISGFLIGSSNAYAEISANVALTTDYIFRGVSQTLEDPAIQGGFDYGHETGFYLGTWASNVDFNEGEIDDADLELDVYGGFSNELPNGLGYDIGILRFIYPGTTADLDYNEYYVGLSYSFNKGSISGSINFSNDVFGSDENGTYYIIGGEYPLPQEFGLSASVGYYDFDDAVFGDDNPDSYTDWKIAVSKEILGVDLELSYTDTDSDGEDLFGELADARAVFTISKAF